MRYIPFDKKKLIVEKEFRFQFTVDMKKNVAKINYIGVKPRFRRDGVGREVVTKFLDYCKKLNIRQIEIDCYKKAINFWKNLGFQIGDRQIFDGVIQDYYNAHLVLK